MLGERMAGFGRAREEHQASQQETQDHLYRLPAATLNWAPAPQRVAQTRILHHGQDNSNTVEESLASKIAISLAVWTCSRWLAI